MTHCEHGGTIAAIHHPDLGRFVAVDLADLPEWAPTLGELRAEAAAAGDVDLVRTIDAITAGELTYAVTVPVTVTVTKRLTADGSLVTVDGACIATHGDALRGEAERAEGVWDAQAAEWRHVNDVALAARGHVAALLSATPTGEA